MLTVGDICGASVVVDIHYTVVLKSGPQIYIYSNNSIMYYPVSLTFGVLLENFLGCFVIS